MEGVLGVGELAVEGVAVDVSGADDGDVGEVGVGGFGVVVVGEVDDGVVVIEVED